MSALVSHCMANPTTPSLDLQPSEPGDDAFSDALFSVVKHAIESGSEADLQTASQQIAFELIKSKDQYDRIHFGISFDPLCLEMAEQIPYDSDKVLDVLRLLELVHTSPELAGHTSERDPSGYDDLAQVLWEFWHCK